MKYSMNLISTISGESGKHGFVGRMKESKAKRFTRLVRYLERAVPIETKKERVRQETPVTVQSDTTDNYANYKLLTIDAIREDGSWSWNDVRLVEEGIFIAEDSELLGNSRKLLKWMRDQEWLGSGSKGKVTIDWGDYDIIEIQSKSTGEPIMALSRIH